MTIQDVFDLCARGFVAVIVLNTVSFIALAILLWHGLGEILAAIRKGKEDIDEQR